ncbi:hypothetical protein BTR22_08275 [Alkalihalophilus pseudofirmus]|uniref:hypothetical protein n=1 Tax=Alkalihalophilus pseudofirmus TaxID=79885 RepID=UPI000951A389|nr:hypothetical protein BTR22_08275 [Alkalihalophilus pseudofirmus]
MIHTTSINQEVTTAGAKKRTPLTFVPGHIFQGKITKLFPNHLASLSINGMQVTARLEAALTAGGRYWFEVQEGSGLPKLKVIDNQGRTGQGSPPPVNEQLIRQLGLPQNTAINALLDQLAVKQLALPKHALKEAAQLLTTLNKYDRQTVDLVHLLIQKNLSLSEEAVRAVQAFQKETGVNQQIQQVIQLAQSAEYASHSSVEKLVSALKQFNAQTEFGQTKQPVLHLLQQLVHPSATAEQHEAAKMLLTRLGLIDTKETMDGFIHRFHQIMLNQQQTSSEVRPLLPPQLTNQVVELQPREAMQHILGSLSKLPQGEKGSLELLFQRLNGSQKALDIEGGLRHLVSQQLPANERSMLQSALYHSVSPAITDARMGFGSHLQNVAALLGLHYESEIARHVQQTNVNELSHQERLKGMLMQLEQSLPLPVREKVTEMIQRITGSQLMAQEQQGPLQQVLMQLPLVLGSYQTDVTLQWEARRQEDGSLDPNHCRILFYLELETLGELIVDMQIQNRVISLTVFNEGDKPSRLIDLLLPTLHDALDGFDYKLTTLTWKNINEYSHNKVQSHHESAYKQRVDYQGVDIRI